MVSPIVGDKATVAWLAHGLKQSSRSVLRENGRSGAMEVSNFAYWRRSNPEQLRLAVAQGPEARQRIAITESIAGNRCDGLVVE
jgi:hypothetical protein